MAFGQTSSVLFCYYSDFQCHNESLDYASSARHRPPFLLYTSHLASATIQQCVIGNRIEMTWSGNFHQGFMSHSPGNSRCN